MFMWSTAICIIISEKVGGKTWLSLESDLNVGKEGFFKKINFIFRFTEKKWVGSAESFQIPFAPHGCSLPQYQCSTAADVTADEAPMPAH